MTTILPIQHRPFDLAAARAGAPYICGSGEEATIFKWDARNENYPLVGMIGSSDEPTSWTSKGVHLIGQDYLSRNLVMIPLGYIDGKPVFAGDKLDWKIGDAITNIEVMPNWRPADLINCTWPAPAKVYPETRMTDLELDVAWNKSPPEYSINSIIRAVANAALRHAIDSGQVVPIDDVKNAILDCGDAVQAATAGRTARDMAIAEAVRNAAHNVIGSVNISIRSSLVYSRISNINLAAIIAGVKS